MIAHIMYKIGHFLSLNCPLKFSYATAVFFADIHYTLGFKERRAVVENLKTVLGKSSPDRQLMSTARDVFRNFAKYLVDFFRFSRMDAEYVNKFIKLEGLSNIDQALKHGRGVIMLSAHVGNWELGGFVLGTLGYPINAVVLTHRNEKVNDFFKNQRAAGKMKSIEFGAALRSCYKALKNNELLALLGDRDFSNNGVSVNFCGRPVVMPKGPAVLSYRTGALIVPCCITRKDDDTFTFVFEKPISPDMTGEENSAIKSIMEKYIPVIESYIKRYPGQWHIFRSFWNEKLRINTVI